MEARRVELQGMKRSQQRKAAEDAGIDEDDWDGSIESILAAEFPEAVQKSMTRAADGEEGRDPHKESEEATQASDPADPDALSAGSSWLPSLPVMALPSLPDMPDVSLPEMPDVGGLTSMLDQAMESIPSIADLTTTTAASDATGDAAAAAPAAAAAAAGGNASESVLRPGVTAAEQKADGFGRADQPMPTGTPIMVAGRGLGQYVGFERNWFGANTHLIRFGTTVPEGVPPEVAADSGAGDADPQPEQQQPEPAAAPEPEPGSGPEPEEAEAEPEVEPEPEPEPELEPAQEAMEDTLDAAEQTPSVAASGAEAGAGAGAEAAAAAVAEGASTGVVLRDEHWTVFAIEFDTLEATAAAADAAATAAVAAAAEPEVAASGAPSSPPPPLTAEQQAAAAEVAAERAGRADQAMPNGALIYVAGRGRGIYAGFVRNWVGSNHHTIKFRAGACVRYHPIKLSTNASFDLPIKLSTDSPDGRRRYQRR
jgi:hypothetical protein